jgi:glycosyltransferase involved in cell wall biosynthesis
MVIICGVVIWALFNMKLGFIIPAYNEHKTISTVVKKLGVYGTPIVVDDCSSDGTAELAKADGAVVVSHQQNRGYDQSLNLGFQKALELELTHVITFDADGQHPAELIPDYIALFQKGNDLVVGIRPIKQRMAESIFALYTKARYGIQDPLCGMKGYKMTHFKEIQSFDTLGLCGTELMLRYLKKGLRVAQLPIPILDRADSPRMGRVFAVNVSIMKSLFKSIFYLN